MPTCPPTGVLPTPPPEESTNQRQDQQPSAGGGLPSFLISSAVMGPVPLLSACLLLPLAWHCRPSLRLPTASLPCRFHTQSEAGLAARQSTSHGWMDGWMDERVEEAAVGQRWSWGKGGGLLERGSK